MIKNLKIRTKLIILFLFGSLIPITVITYFSYVTFSESLSKESLSLEQNLVKEQKTAITSYLDHFDADLAIIKDFSSFIKLLDEPEISPTSTIKNDVIYDFLSFVQKHNFYYELKYIDETGQEIIEIEQSDLYQKPFIESADKLQDQSNDRYFKEVMLLSENKLYISPLDLNIKNGEIENRGTIEKPIYVPVLRLATPVFNSQKQKKGIVFIKLYADIILKNVFQENRTTNIEKGRTTMLINKDGYYLYHDEDSLRWGFMFENDNTLFKLYPTISEKLLKKDSGQFFYKDSNSQFTFEKIFLFNRLYQKSLNPKIVQQFNEENLLDTADTFWILVTQTQDESIKKPIKKTLNTYLAVIGIILIIITFISFLLNKSITGSILKLKKGISKIKEGNLKYRIHTTGNDELDLLGKSINEMVEELEKSKRNIEKQVKKRTEETEKLNQFLIGRELKMIKLKNKLKKNKNTDE